MTTNMQPWTLRLAEELERLTTFSLRRDLEPTLLAADALRRLHAENLLLHERHAGDNQILRNIETQRDELRDENRRLVNTLNHVSEVRSILVEQRDELLEALQLYLAHASEPECAIWRHVQQTARTAIAKATGE